MNKKEKNAEKKETKKEDSPKNTKEGQGLVFEKDEKYTPEQAIELCKKMTKTKFDSSVEVHLRLGKRRSTDKRSCCPASRNRKKDQGGRFC